MIQLRRRPAPGTVLAFACAILAAAVAAAVAEPGDWSVDVGAVQLEIDGLDEHVLTRRDAAGATPVHLDTGSELGYHVEVVREGARWSWGADFVLLVTDQRIPRITDPRGPAGAGPGPVFELPDLVFAPAADGDVLYYETLEDTTVELWWLDVEARRRVVDRPRAMVDLHLGVRSADFDNDYRAIGGVDPTGGVRIDSSSNYSRMTGPVVGISGELARGRHSLRATLRQAVVRGDVELKSFRRFFSGPPGPFAVPPEEVPDGERTESLRDDESVSISMTDLRAAYTLGFGPRVSLRLFLEAAAWNDLPVPPGSTPGTGGSAVRLEETMELFGAGAGLVVRF